MESDTDYDMLLEQTAWSVIQNEYVTSGFAASCRSNLDADKTNRDELEVQIGRDESDTRFAKWQSNLTAIKDCFVVCYMFLSSPYLGISKNPESPT